VDRLISNNAVVGLSVSFLIVDTGRERCATLEHVVGTCAESTFYLTQVEVD
jgi:hypothetical protein